MTHPAPCIDGMINNNISTSLFDTHWFYNTFILRTSLHFNKNINTLVNSWVLGFFASPLLKTETAIIRGQHDMEHISQLLHLKLTLLSDCAHKRPSSDTRFYSSYLYHSLKLCSQLGMLPVCSTSHEHYISK